MNLKNKSSLIASCGINCQICYAFLREKNKCPGCRLFNKKEPVSIARCKIRTCDIKRKNKDKFCFNCKDFPCNNLKHLDKRYRTKYNVSMIENLFNIKKLGIQKFLKYEKEKWKCAECSGVICVHKKLCCNCGIKKF